MKFGGMKMKKRGAKLNPRKGEEVSKIILRVFLSFFFAFEFHFCAFSTHFISFYSI